MPELPDIAIVCERLAARWLGASIEGVRIGNPFVLRTTDPPVAALVGAPITGVRRVGKQIAIEVGATAAVLHLMIAGRLHVRRRGASERGRDVLLVFDLPDAALVFTEASKQKRASLHVVPTDHVAAFHRGGLDVLGSDLADFTVRLRSERHTLKRALTDPRLFDGIGNAYSDEILFHARLSPIRQTTALSDTEIERLHVTCRSVLTDATEVIRREVGDGFPEHITAFREDFFAHGRFKQPCRVCGHPIQRIVHGEHETKYCAACQTEGRLLADRALSRLLKADWPRTLDELERRSAG